MLILNSDVLRYYFSGIQAMLSVGSSEVCCLDTVLRLCVCFPLPWQNSRVMQFLGGSLFSAGLGVTAPCFVAWYNFGADELSMLLHAVALTFGRWELL